MTYKPLNKPTTVQKVMRTVKWVVPAVLLLVEGCSNQNNGDRIQSLSNTPTQPPVQQKNEQLQDDKTAHAKLFGNVLTIVSENAISWGRYPDSHPKIKPILKKINAKTLEGADLSGPTYDEKTGMTTFQVTPQGAEGWILVSVTAGGIIEFAGMKN